MAPDGHGHDLAQHSLAGAGADVPAVGEHSQAQQHRAENQAEHELGLLCPGRTGLLEQRHPVGNRFHAGQRAASC
jgi:hypothetical protein